jgi:hypothetical protein
MDIRWERCYKMRMDKLDYLGLSFIGVVLIFWGIGMIMTAVLQSSMGGLDLWIGMCVGIILLAIGCLLLYTVIRSKKKSK